MLSPKPYKAYLAKGSGMLFIAKYQSFALVGCGRLHATLSHFLNC